MGRNQTEIQPNPNKILVNESQIKPKQSQNPAEIQPKIPVHEIQIEIQAKSESKAESKSSRIQAQIQAEIHTENPAESLSAKPERRSRSQSQPKEAAGCRAQLHAECPGVRSDAPPDGAPRGAL